MTNVKKYVDHLFKGYIETQQIKELKEEIVSNLEAKVEDLTSQGLGYEEAVRIASKDLNGIEHLIEDNKKFYTNRFKLELFQLALLYSIIAWIITTPLQIVGMGILINYALLFLTMILGITYLLFNANKNDSYINKIGDYSVRSIVRYKKMSWIIWGLFIVISLFKTTALHFGSNIWFMRSISIDGPYQFAVLLISYLIPFLSVFIPILFTKSQQLIYKHEVGGE